MSKAVITKSVVTGYKNGVEKIPGFKNENYEYEIEFEGRCPKRSTIKNQLSDIFKDNKVIETIDVKTNSKNKGKLSLSVSISAIDNVHGLVYDFIDDCVNSLISKHNQELMLV